MADACELRVLDARVPMRDGIHLAADVTLVDDGQARPALLVRTPYSRAGLRAAHDPVASARAGWAVVLQDVRGRGESDGVFRPFAQEVEDGFDAVTWCAEQPWCDGRVAMTGMSYNGATQWLAALGRPPALKAIAPSVIGPDLRASFAFTGGAFCQGFLSSWAVALAASAPDPDAAARALELFDEWPALLRGADAGRQTIADVLPDYGRWVPRQEDYWAPVDVWAQLPQLDLPVWRLAGWYDLFCEETLDGYAAMVDHARCPQRLIVGPWTHAAMHAQATPEVDFGMLATGAHLAVEVDAFLKAGLDGAPAKDGVTVFVMGKNSWHDLPRWPPPSTPLVLHLADAGGLAESASAGGQRVWRHDPSDPVPTRGGRTLQAGLPMAGPLDQRLVESRPDVLVWTSAELDDDITVVGTVTARLRVSSSSSTFDVVVKVCDVHPDGRSLNVVDSIQRTTSPPGEPNDVEVRVGSTAITFRRGHRIRVLVASSDFPQYDLLPAGEQTLFLGSSVMALPVVDPGVLAHA